MIVTGILMGLGGTLAMDAWALVLRLLGNQPYPNWAMPGRWFAHLFRGKVFHDDIGAADPVKGELQIGWAFHYAVGILYGIVFIAIAGQSWLSDPSFPPVWIFAIVTIAAGWFLLQPGMGLGWAASKTPNPWKVRGLGLAAHTTFGLGMWLAFLMTQ